MKKSTKSELRVFHYDNYFWFLFIQPIYEDQSRSGQVRSPKGLPKKTFGDCWCNIFYRPTDLPVTQPTVSKHWKEFGINWMAPWKNRISSTTMKLRKSLVKPVTRQNISSCLVLPPKIVMHDDTFNVIHWTSADICVVVHDDLGWKNQTTRCNRF